ncbi:hypothetical protein GRI58_01320 [Porphyrobacter algicida]|uniref:TraB/GumN family protein n=1 Tax=Qipengyuania algicida TaxID=1836209 RepID=A0A845AET3_9SPHN|nr:hypothetical protein [Qipengyuania algicida]
MSIVLAILAAATSPVATANPQTQVAQAVDIGDTAARKRGDRSHVLVLGTAHLSHLPKTFDTARLKPLLDKLAKWDPQSITVEGISGEQCDYLRSYEFAYPGTAEDYCPDTLAAREALRVTGPEAEKAVLALLKHKDHTPAERRRIAGLFLAIGEPESAMLQWEQLPKSEQHADENLPEAQVARLEKEARYRNENVSIAVALGVKLGLDRIYRVDDHTGDRAGVVADEKAYDRELPLIWKSKLLDQRIAQDDAKEKVMLAGGSVIDWYRDLNSPANARLAMETDFGAAAGSTKYPATGRAYLAYWETRNLRIAANIREVLGSGGRVLSIIGASHKPYLERYLGMTSDVVIDNVEKVLTD